MDDSLSLRDFTKPYGELWIDWAGDAHFQCHSPDADNWNATKEAIQKFIGVLQKQLDNEDACPFNPHLDLKKAKKVVNKVIQENKEWLKEMAERDRRQVDGEPHVQV